jgi:hypothetical protein
MTTISTTIDDATTATIDDVSIGTAITARDIKIVSSGITTNLSYIKIEVIEKPSGSNIQPNNRSGTASGSPILTVGSNTSLEGIDKLKYIYPATGTFPATGSPITIGTLTINPDVVGKYVIKVSGMSSSTLTNSSIKYVTVNAEGIPTLTSQPAIVNVDSLTAILPCLVNPNYSNAVITCTFTPNEGAVSAGQTLTRGTAPITLSFNATGLSLGTYTYTFTYDPTNAAATTAARTFTLVKKPDAFPVTLTDKSGTTATLKGSVITNGANTNVYFEYSTDRDFTDTVYQAGIPTQEHIAANTARSVTVLISGLERDERYYYRLVAENSAGITTSSSLNFDTNDVPEIDPDKIVVEFGKVTLEWTDVDAEEYEVEWDIANTFVTAAKSSKLVSENKAIITNLTNGTTYFFRVRVLPGGSYSNIVELNVATSIKLDSFTPQSGSFMGGTQVSLYGENLMRTISVTFETYPEKTPAEIISQTDDKIVVKAPAISNLIPVMNRLKVKASTSTLNTSAILSDFYKGKIRLTDDKGNITDSATNFVYTITPTTTGPVCFPAEATVVLKDGTMKKMADLAIGDHIQISADGECSEVYLFTHALPTAEANFLTFTLESGITLSLTPCHYIYVNGTLMSAERAAVGDTVESTSSKSDRIKEITLERKQGLYNPHTLTGDIMVNNVRTSTYTHILPAGMAHAILEPVRFLYKIGKLF